MQIPARTSRLLSELFGIDLRTLALFRAALGAVLLFYCFNRLPDLSAFFTDWGVLPRSYLVQFEGWSRLSLYLINGEAWFAATLLALTALCALALLVGYRTRAATVALFVLFGSLVNRNPLILLGGDSLLVCLLFWGMFLPLGARWSVDRALATNPAPEKNQHVSWASAGLLLQVMSVYFFSAWLKNGPDWWPDGLGVYYTMELERYASRAGLHVLRQLPEVMHALSYFVWFLEWFGPLLCFSPVARKPLRFLVMLSFMAMHTGFIVFMKIGYFPFVSLVSLTTLLGGWFWDWRMRVNEALHPNGPKIFYDGPCSFCLKTCKLFVEFLVLPRARIAPAQESQRANALLTANYSWVVIDTHDVAHVKWPAFVALVRYSPLFGFLHPLLAWKGWEKPGNFAYDFVGRHRGSLGELTARLLPEREVKFEAGRLAQGVAGLFVALVLAWNLTTVAVVPSGFALAEMPLFRVLRIDQIWNMFAPEPSHRDGWFVYPGKLEDGTEVDVLKPGEPLSWDRPPYLSETYENLGWHSYRWRITDKQYNGNLLYYGKYLCREWNWNAKPGKHLLTFDMDLLEELSPPPGGETRVERRVIWHHECRPADTEREKKEEQEKKDDPVQEDRSRPV